MEKLQRFLAKLWKWAAWPQFIVLTAIATYLSLTPDPGDSFSLFSDKVLHAACWFVLALSLHLAIRKASLPWYCALLLLFYSGGIEILQGLMPPREMSAADLLANSVGISVALVVTLVFAPLYQRWILTPLFSIRSQSTENKASE